MLMNGRELHFVDHDRPGRRPQEGIQAARDVRNIHQLVRRLPVVLGP